MRKSLALQDEMAEEFKACVFDVTLDCEDGAPVGGESDHAAMVVALIREHVGRSRAHLRATPRMAVRTHPVHHPAFQQDIELIVGGVGDALCHLMVPKVESVHDIEAVLAAISRAPSGLRAYPLPLHALVESPAAVHRAFEIAAHPNVQSISFGLMDFVSAHGGAIAAEGMSGAGQFRHPLVVRAKLEIASACHAYGKVPSHCVVTEFRDLDALQIAARTAANEFGYTRMWSIHPGQIRTILAAFAPAPGEIELASEIISRAQRADWAPMDFRGQLHDRASYRYFWQILERAHQTGQTMPDSMQPYFASPLH